MVPSTTTIEKALRAAVQRTKRVGEAVTVNAIRSVVEDELDLDSGYFKGHTEWKSRSKDVISAAFEDEGSEPASTPKASKKRPAPRHEEPVLKKVKTDTDSTKTVSKAARKPANTSKTEPPKKTVQKKHSRKVSSSESDDNGSEDGHESQHLEEEDRDSDSSVQQPQPVKNDRAKSKGTLDDEESEDTDVSLIDEPPARRKTKKNDTTSSKKSEKRKSLPKSRPVAASSLNEDDETIKTLQKQLLQCGVRKQWARLLADYDRPRDKINHLKGMLTEIGMTGRFSAEKAAKIKEKRELAAEIESAQDFERSWGYDADAGRGRRSRTTKSMAVDALDSEDEETVAPPRPRAATGLVDFGDSGDSGSD